MVLSNRLDPDVDITLQPLPDTASQLAAMNAAAVDGLVSNFGGVSTFAEAAGTGVSWDYMSGDEDLMEFPFNVIVASEYYIGSSADSIQRFLDALFEARAALVAFSPEDAEALKAAVAPDMEQRPVEATLKSTQGSHFPT